MVNIGQSRGRRSQKLQPSGGVVVVDIWVDRFGPFEAIPAKEEARSDCLFFSYDFILHLVKFLGIA